MTSVVPSWADVKSAWSTGWRELLASAIRLGHPTVDLWLSAVALTGNLQGRPGREDRPPSDLAEAFLARLDAQRGETGLTSWRELRDLADHHALILETNFSDLDPTKLGSLPQYFQAKLSRQNPVLGMHGNSKNQQALVQFRMPGYPMAIVCTDILQEGIDLHTFCGRVLHYGIAHTSSATEQRTGRIDRIGCLTQRRLAGADDSPEAKLQVHYPHLLDTIEPVQMLVLYRRMDHFLRLLFSGLDAGPTERSLITMEDSIFRDIEYPQPTSTELQSAFEVQPEDLQGQEALPSVEHEARWTPGDLRRWMLEVSTAYEVDVHDGPDDFVLIGEAWLLDGALVPRGADCATARRQPFQAWIDTRSDGRGQRLRVVSPVGKVNLSDGRTAGKILRLQDELLGCGFYDTGRHEYTLGVRADVPLEPGCDGTRRLSMALYVVTSGADVAEQRLVGEDVDARFPTFESSWAGEEAP